MIVSLADSINLEQTMPKQKIAFLGPSGSYTELALKEFARDFEALACNSVAEVFDHVSSKSEIIGFVPIENLIQGPVTETLDLLFEHRAQVKIHASHVMQIEHVLATLGNEKLETITQVFSHPQALQQCSNFLHRNLPSAKQEPTASTSAAIEHIEVQELKNAAVIAARKSVEGKKLKILNDEIANSKNNKTRFILIADKNFKNHLQVLTNNNSENEVTSVAINPGRDKKGLLFEILQIISIKHEINLLSIHSRPDRKGGFVFFFDLEGDRREKKILDCIRNLKLYCEQNTGDTAEIIVFGSYQRLPFVELAFKSVGIIGGEGRMGKWFAETFEQSGLEVHICDKGTKLGIKDICELSDVILISVPMSAASSVCKELAKFTRRGQLVVENCSIKSSILPELTRTLSKDVEILGAHTMFAVDIESLHGENIILTKTKSSGPLAQSFEDFLYKHGAEITHATSIEHDRISSFNQSLLHFVLVALAEVMREKIGAGKALEEFSTPNSRSIIQAMRRVLNQSDELLVDMQMLNLEAKEIRSAFLEAAKNFAKAIENGNASLYLESARKSREFFK